MKSGMRSFCTCMAAVVSLSVFAWSSSTAWQWNTDGRAGTYPVAQSGTTSNAEAFGPRVNLVRTATPSGFETLEARVFGFTTLTDLVFDNMGTWLYIR